MLPRILALTTLLLALAACGSEDDAPADDARPFNDADVAFATDMVQHHAQALTMVDLTVERDVTPGLAAMAEQIRAAQGPEIEEMVDLLEEWGQEVPETMRDHANAEDHGGMDMDSDMPGMLSSEELDELESADGAAFEELWLESMIEHHEGAIDMAETEVADGEDADAVTLAEKIVSAQEEEIVQMQEMLAER